MSQGISAYPINIGTANSFNSNYVGYNIPLNNMSFNMNSIGLNSNQANSNNLIIQQRNSSPYEI